MINLKRLFSCKGKNDANEHASDDAKNTTVYDPDIIVLDWTKASDTPFKSHASEHLTMNDDRSS